MFREVELGDAEGCERFCTLAGISTVTAETVARQRPDALWMLLDDSGRVGARCSLWWTHAPAHGQERLGLIGHLAIREPACAAFLLAMACAQLESHGCTMAVGPMDGTTWNHYRLVTERGAEPAFFLEPDNPDEWPSYFTAAGFAPIAHYYSALNADLSQAERELAEAAARLPDKELTFRPLQLDGLDDELRRVHALSLVSFRANFLYTPIDVEDFVARYRSIRPSIHPDLVILAEQGDRLVGYIFALPDALQAKRGQVVDTVIIKTMAAHRDLADIGLGRLLMAQCHATIKRLGYRRAIHALIHEANRSGRISRHTARAMRRYALFARTLGKSR